MQRVVCSGTRRVRRRVRVVVEAGAAHTCSLASLALTSIRDRVDVECAARDACRPQRLVGERLECVPRARHRRLARTPEARLARAAGRLADLPLVGAHGTTGAIRLASSGPILAGSARHARCLAHGAALDARGAGRARRARGAAVAPASVVPRASAARLEDESREGTTGDCGAVASLGLRQLWGR
eukprot:2398924-Prymnesium_polylepis.2